MSKAALYLRVSTNHQIDKDSLPLQRRDLIAYSEMILGIKDYVVFEDAGFSGKNTARPAYQDMLQRCRDGEFSHILVWKLDRISRNLLDFAGMYAEIKQLGITFISRNEQFDTSTAMGEAMLKIILVFAELERKMTSERVTAVMLNRARQGMWNGANIPYGYTWDAEKKFPAINEAEAAVVRDIFQKYTELRSLVKVSQYLHNLGVKTKRGGHWAEATVKQMIRNPFYKGTLRYNYKSSGRGKVKPESEWIVVENSHPALIAPELWQRCNDICDDNASKNNRLAGHRVKQHFHIFASLLRCGGCGGGMSSHIDIPRKSGVTPSLYNCTIAIRKPDLCTMRNSTTDKKLISFLLRYLGNLFTAYKNAGTIESAQELQSALLAGPELANVQEVAGVETIYTSMRASVPRSALSSDGTTVSMDDTAATSLRAQIAIKERAVKRLESLFLYSEDAMGEAEYVQKKNDLIREISILRDKLEALAHASTVDDYAFLKSIGSLAIFKEFTTVEAIDYQALILAVGTQELHDFFKGFFKFIEISKGKITAVQFSNGIRHDFVYE